MRTRVVWRFIEIGFFGVSAGAIIRWYLYKTRAGADVSKQSTACRLIGITDYDYVQPLNLTFRKAGSEWVHLPGIPVTPRRRPLVVPVLEAKGRRATAQVNAAVTKLMRTFRMANAGGSTVGLSALCAILS